MITRANPDSDGTESGAGVITAANPYCGGAEAGAETAV